jgi:putative FmdB family regulatory protein
VPRQHPSRCPSGCFAVIPGYHLAANDLYNAAALNFSNYGFFRIIMPIYEYQCAACGHRFETLQKISDKPFNTCPDCGKDALTKLISASAFRLKGGGWYETDFKTGSKKNVAEADKKTGTDTRKDAATKTDTKKDTTTKPAGTSATKKAGSSD